MSMFQKSVEKKYLNELDSSFVDKKYADFQNYFGNPERQENIRNSKEEQFQEGFLRELFVNILGYTLNPEPNFNLTTELKNISNSKKADGAILKGDNATAVIELKGTNTTDLDKIETQAFGYKNHHPKCIYVITSNFEKLRFYIQNAVDHVDFDLFNLSKEQFSLLWLCLSKDNLLADLPFKIKDSSVLQEENITKKLYADYSKFREAIYNNLIKNNPETDKLLLFKKTQKLLDRFLFIFFAEDRLLLPPNSISEIIKQWKTLKDELDEYIPLYARFKKYFGYMNTGFKGKKYDIYAYNGGLFKPDEILDNILIDDDILHEHTVKLSNYDFETDVDVNILGHIFEHSLGEIAAIAATSGLIPLTDTRVISKRKKDGIFYTPKYITKYIVENTVGKLCNEKRNELQIIDEEYAKGRKNRKKEIVRTLDKKLDEYRNWLLSLTILDPACGSGAFLNQALEFLINEHRKIDELRAQLFGGAIIFSDITTDILEKNIFGVDLNEESVEIAKLSLWLRTAQKGRKLNTLSNNIKCGNSLIDDPGIAGDKAFNWNKEFPNVFSKKEKKAWHITTAIHNSRYSQRMFDYHITTDNANWLSENDEIVITEIIAGIVKEDKLNVIEYNICGDHMHLLLVCEEEELTKIAGKIKGKSARLYNSNKGINPLVRLDGEKSVPLWTQKFGKSKIRNEDYLNNAITYIRNNRIKHELPKSERIEEIKKEFLCTKEHAFRTEYKGGFDVVIGNPPYGADLKDSVSFLKSYYKTFSLSGESYILFVEKSCELLRYNGRLGFIIPDTYLNLEFSFPIREYLLKNSIIEEIVLLPAKVFESATVDTTNLIIQKKNYTDTFYYNDVNIKLINKKSNSIDFNEFNKEFTVSTQLWNSEKSFLIQSNNEEIILIQKIDQGFYKLKTFAEMFSGIKCYEVGKGNPPQTPQIRDEKPFTKEYQVNSNWLPFFEGKHVDRYQLSWNQNSWLNYGNWLAAPREKENFVNEKILIRKIVGSTLICNYVPYTSYCNTLLFVLKLPPQSKINYLSLLGILNSKFIGWYYRHKFQISDDDTFPQIMIRDILKFPIPNNNSIEIENYVSDLMEKMSNFQNLKNKFIGLVQDNFTLTSISKKIDTFYESDFRRFLSELKKQKVTLSLTDQSKWKDFFETTKSEITKIKSEIEKTDKETDRMVYELYGLTEEEVKIVENS